MAEMAASGERRALSPSRVELADVSAMSCRVSSAM
jgi:hypothetical protein